MYLRTKVNSTTCCICMIQICIQSPNEIESLMNRVRIFSNDVIMEFELDRCVTIRMKRGKLVQIERVTLVGKEMSTLAEKASTNIFVL